MQASKTVTFSYQPIFQICLPFSNSTAQCVCVQCGAIVSVLLSVKDRREEQKHKSAAERPEWSAARNLNRKRFVWCVRILSVQNNSSVCQLWSAKWMEFICISTVQHSMKAKRTWSQSHKCFHNIYNIPLYWFYNKYCKPGDIGLH